MPRGTVEVLLVSAKGLENMDSLKNMDPYCIIMCRTQEQKSTVARGEGTKPKWNETFTFSVSGSTDIRIKILDEDHGSDDDLVGEAVIPLETVFEQGKVPPTSYNVIRNEKFKGEIKVGLTFTPEEDESTRDFEAEENEEENEEESPRRGHAPRRGSGGYRQSEDSD